MSELMKEAWDALDTGVVALEKTILRSLLARQAIPYQQPRLQSPQPEEKKKATENIKSNRKQGKPRNRKHVRTHEGGMGCVRHGRGCVRENNSTVAPGQTSDPIPATETSKSST